MSFVDIFGLCLTEIVGDFGYKYFANTGGLTNFAIGTTGYVGVIYFLIRSLQGSQVLLVNSAWDGLSALIESSAAMLFLGERFDDPMKYLGICFIIVGLFFLKLPLNRINAFKFPKFFKYITSN